MSEIPTLAGLSLDGLRATRARIDVLLAFGRLLEAESAPGPDGVPVLLSTYLARVDDRLLEGGFVHVQKYGRFVLEALATLPVEVVLNRLLYAPVHEMADGLGFVRRELAAEAAGEPSDELVEMDGRVGGEGGHLAHAGHPEPDADAGGVRQKRSKVRAGQRQRQPRGAP